MIFLILKGLIPIMIFLTQGINPHHLRDLQLLSLGIIPIFDLYARAEVLASTGINPLSKKYHDKD